MRRTKRAVQQASTTMDRNMEAKSAAVEEGMHTKEIRQLPVGAEVLTGGVNFRVWASKRRRVELVLEGGPGTKFNSTPVVVALDPEGGGYFSKTVAEARPRTLYRYRLDGEETLYAD